MRHLVRGRKLGRTASHRKATLSALSVALIKHDRIVTTLAKAKALRSYVEPIITRSKEDNTHNRGLVFRHLRDNKATSRLFDDIAPMVADRPGGYTRIVKLGPRPGDGAEKAMIELVDFNESQSESAGKKRKRTRRGGTSAKKKAAAPKTEVSKEKSAEESSKKNVTSEEEVVNSETATAEEEVSETETKKTAGTSEEPKQEDTPESDDSDSSEEKKSE